MAKSLQWHDTLIDGDKMLRAMLDHSSSIVFAIDFEFRIQFISRVPSGLKASNVLGTSCLDYVPLEFHQVVVDAVRQVQKSGAPTTYEIEARGPDDSVSWYSTQVLPLPSEQSTPLVLLLTEDITETKRQAQLLYESEALFHALITASADVVYRMSPDWTELRYLDGRDFVADTHQPSTSWLAKYIHPDDQGQVMATIQEALREGKPFELEHRVLRIDGSLGWTNSRAIPMLDAQGRISEWIGMASDVTIRREAQEALTKSRQLLDLALSNAELAIWSVDFISGNAIHDERYCAMLGYTPDEFGQTIDAWRIRLHPDDQVSVDESIRAHETGETPLLEMEFRMKHKQGYWIWMRCRGKTTFDADSRPIHATGTIQDITSQKRVSTEGAELLRKFEALIAGLGSRPSDSGTSGSLPTPRSKIRLSGRNREVLQLIAEGMTSAQIAKELGITEGTAASHRRNVMHKLGLKNKAEVVRYALKHGIVTD